MSFTALVVDKDEEGTVSQNIETLDDSRLPDGDVTVDVAYSTLNYKDGLCITGKGGLVRDTSRYAVVEQNVKGYANESGLEVAAFFDSPIEGGDGNREFLMVATKR